MKILHIWCCLAAFLASVPALAEAKDDPAPKSQQDPAAAKDAPAQAQQPDAWIRSPDRNVRSSAQEVSPESKRDQGRVPGALSKGKLPLLNTYWKLLAIEDSPVQVREGSRESHMRLIEGSNRFIGQGICNRVGGAFELTGRKLKFDVSVSMPSPCWADGPPETALTDALSGTVRYEIRGQDLYLIDEEGVRRAHFQALLRPGERMEPRSIGSQGP